MIVRYEEHEGHVIKHRVIVNAFKIEEIDGDCPMLQIFYIMNNEINRKEIHHSFLKEVISQ